MISEFLQNSTYTWFYRTNLVVVFTKNLITVLPLLRYNWYKRYLRLVYKQNQNSSIPYSIRNYYTQKLPKI